MAAVDEACKVVHSSRVSGERLLITGPGGRVGKLIVPLLRKHFALRLLDSGPVEHTTRDEYIQADIRNFDAVRAACEGVGAVLHLAAVSDEADFLSRLLPINLEGLYTVVEAARQANVPKFLFASTGQTVLNYGPGTWVTPEMPVRPSTVYGCTKVFGEALARHYSDIHGMSMICIRICFFQSPDSRLLRERPEMRREWCSPRDLTQLILKSIGADLPFAVFFGVSNNTGRYWDIRNAQELVGYDPQDDGAQLPELSTPESDRFDG